MTLLAPHLTAFLRERLAVHRRASVHTCEAYAYSFQLLLDFTTRKLGIRPSSVSLEQWDAMLLLEFLDHLQASRHNSASTRNARLAAIKSFMRFLEHRVPSALDQLHRVLAIPSQRTNRAVVPHLTSAEAQALLDVPDATTRMGVRDRAMLHVALAGGLRVSELVGLRMEDVRFDGRYMDLVVRGKGRRERLLRLWKAVADSVRAWLAVRGTAAAPEVFLSARAEPLTRAGFEYVLDRCKTAASTHCPSLSQKRVSPHVLRHTCAMSVLKSTGDLRKVALWLGHASITTSEMYLAADPVEKLEALAGMVPPALKPGKFRAPDRLLAALKG